MKKLTKWALYGVLALLVPIACIAAPIGYVELACQGDAQAKPYKSMLDAKHHRPETRTLMTYPEWHIVHAYDDYAKVVSVGAPHEFGYASSIAGFWSSLCSLSEQSAQLGDVDTETKQMVYVIGASFSVELAFKALYEETIGRIFTWVQGNAQSKLDKLSADHAREYAQFLQQTPWYKWRFREAGQELKSAGSSSVRDHERSFSLGLEYGAKAAYADVIANAVDSTGKDALTLQMVVQGTNAGQLQSLSDVKVVSTTAEGTVIRTPRYRTLTHLLYKWANDGMNFVEIAGNDQIMFSALSAKPGHTQALASMKRQGYNDYRHLFLVKVSDLAGTLRQLNDNGLTLEHIHDY